MIKNRNGTIPFFVWPLLLLACVAALLMLATAAPEAVEAPPVPPQLYSSTYQLLGCGNRLGTYFPAGQALAEWFNDHLTTNQVKGGAFKAIETNGSVENVVLLNQKRILLGMAESRIVNEYKSGNATGPLRLVWPLWNDVVHLVASPDSARHKVAFPGEIRNYTGQTNSSTSRTSSEILKALGYTARHNSFDLPPEEVMPALISGQIGFATIQAGIPNKTVSDALSFHGCELFSLRDDQLEKILPRVASARRTVIPAGFYGDKQNETLTIGLPNMLVTNNDASPILIEKIVELLTGGQTYLRLKHQALSEVPVDIDTALEMMRDTGVEIHSGTMAFINKRKMAEAGGENR